MFVNEQRMPMPRHRSLSVFLGFILLAGMALFYFVFRSKPCQRLHCISFQNRENFRLQEVYQDDKTIYRALLASGHDLLRVEVRSHITPNVAEQYIQGEITRMKALFANAISPYPGEISQEIVCGEKFTPQFTTYDHDGLPISYFKGYLNSRLVFDACSEDQAVYRGFLALFYCPKQKQLFQLEIIAPTGEFDTSPQKYSEILGSIRCRKQNRQVI